MRRIFQERDYNALSAKLLPYSEFKFFSDLDSSTLDAEKAEQIVKKAEELLSAEFPVLTLSSYREYFVNGIRGNYEGRMHRRREILFPLVVAESYERRGRFIEKIADIVWMILEETSWVFPAHIPTASKSRPDTSVPETYRPEAMFGIDLGVSSTSALLAFVLYYLREELDEISPLISDRIEYTLNERFIKPFIHCVFAWDGELKRGWKPNNWLVHIMANVLTVLAVCVKDSYYRTLVFQKVLMRLDNYTEALPEDGGCDEGAGYWTGAGASLFDCLEIIYDLTGGEVNLLKDQLIVNAGEYIQSVNIHDDRFVNFADCGPFFRPDGTFVARYGRRCGSDSLNAFGNKLAKGQANHINYRHAYRTIKNSITPFINETIVTYGELKSYAPGNCIMTAREERDTSRGLYLAVKGGDNAESHNHNDVGSFIVYKNGNPVLIDPGVGYYTRQTFSSERYNIWHHQSAYHNLVTIGGFDQQAGKEMRATDARYDAESGALSMQLKEAYPKLAGILSFVRTSRLGDGEIVICDEISTDTEKELEWHFMTRYEPSLLEAGVIELPEGAKLYYNADMNVRIERQDTPTMDFERTWGTDCLWRICISQRTQKCKEIFTIK